jgi:hypothetical protein
MLSLLIINPQLCTTVQDFDGGDVGTNISQSFSSFTGADMITWTVHPSSDFPNGPSDLQYLVLEEKIWVGVAST